MSMIASCRELAVSVDARPTHPFEEVAGEPADRSASDGADAVVDGSAHPTRAGDAAIERFESLAALALATVADPRARLLRGALPIGPVPGGNAPPAGGDTTERVKSLFKEQFGAKAADKEGFHAFMQQIYGSRYDRGLAEEYRQRALAGDYGWLPEVKLVDPRALGGANGAYNADEGVVYVNRDLASSDPAKAAQTFVEEAGHHLDARLNGADTQGDEGEMFRRVLSGEQLSAQQLADIRNENDHGTIVVDGKQVDVEFWFGSDLWDGAKDAAGKVGDAVGDAADAIGDGADALGDAAGEVGDALGDALSDAGDKARDAAYSFGDAIKHAGGGILGAAEEFFEGLGKDLFGGFLMNMIELRPADAWEAVGNGLDKMAFQAPKKLFNGMLDGAGDLLKTPTFLLPEKGGSLVRDVVDRGVDSVRSIGDGVIDIGRTVFRLPFEIGTGFMQDIGQAAKDWLRGDVGDALESLGMAIVNPFKEVGGALVDAGVIAGQAAGNVAGNLTGQHEPSRGLSNAERDYLKSLYGDSLDLDDIRIHRGNVTNEMGLGQDGHTVGNDIYLPDECFNEDGSLNDDGMQRLAHEAFHVYQSQHGGNDYINGALQAQGEAAAGGNILDAYDWVVPLREGKPFEQWNPEQQARFIETLAKAKYGYDLNGNGQIELGELNLAWADTDGSGKIDGMETFPNLSPDEFQRLMGIWQAIKDDRPDRMMV